MNSGACSEFQVRGFGGEGADGGNGAGVFAEQSVKSGG